MKITPPKSPANKFLCLPDGPDRLARAFGLERLSKTAVEGRVADWLRGTVLPPRCDADAALEALAWAGALPHLAAMLSPHVWQDLLDGLLGLVAEARALDPDQNALIHQLLAGELAWTLAAAEPDRPECRGLEKPARAILAAGLNRLLDRQGMPHARHLGLLRPLLACWTRARAIGQQLPGRGFGTRMEQRYERLVRSALRLARHDGRPAFSNGEAGPWGGELFDAALRLDPDGPNRAIAALALRGSGRKPPKQRAKSSLASHVPSPAVHSEWAATAVLRRGWSAADERLTVLFPEQSVELELNCGGRVVWSGAWQWEVRHDGEPVLPVSPWQSTCWVSDDDVDYLELEIALAGGLRIQRHLALARKDRFLLLADAVLGERPGKLEYCGILPLAPGIEFHAAEESREGILIGRKAKSNRPGVAAARTPHAPRVGMRHADHARMVLGDEYGVPPREVRLVQVLPLALPEWRSDRRCGELAATSRGLELRQAIEGRRLLAPLFFDLDRGRFRQRLTWRPLTVAQSLTRVPADVATGYRVAIGNQQWLFYRSLGAKGNRTLLGHNLATETLLARFSRKGEVTSIVEIE